MKGTGFSPTHCELWRCCEQMATEASQAQKGAFYFDMAQMLFAFLSYESYLNFVGCRVAPKEWLNERSFFSLSPFQGIKGKLKLLEEKLAFKIDRSTDPYQTVAGLEQLRDFLSHGKPEIYPITSAAIKRSPDFPFSGKLDHWITQEKAERARSQVLGLCRIIHRQAKSTDRLKNDRQFGEEPFSQYEEVEWVP